MKKVLIYGSGDLGLVVKNLIQYTDYRFSGFISDISDGPDVLGSFDSIIKNYSPEEFGIVLAIGYSDLENRFRIYKDIKEKGFILPVIKHPSSYLCNTAKVMEGVIVMPGCNVDYNTVIEEICVLWPHTVISHDSIIGTNSFLSPNSTVCGFCNIGKNCFIGAGAVIVDHTTVPDNSFVKAGSLYKNIKL